MNQIIKIIGMVVAIDEKNIHLNLHDYMCDIKNNTIEKLTRLDEQITKKITKIKFDDDIETIQIFKPIYHKHFRGKGKEIKNMHVKLTISKNKSEHKYINKETLLGYTVYAYVKPSIYNFTDPKNKEKKIRGWKLQLISVQKLN